MTNVKQMLQDLFFLFLLLILAFILGLTLQKLTQSQSLVSMIFVLAAFLISLITQGYLWGILASLVSVLIFNYVFSFPYFAFDFLTTANLVSAFVMLIVAVITSTLTSKHRKSRFPQTRSAIQTAA